MGLLRGSSSLSFPLCLCMFSRAIMKLRFQIISRDIPGISASISDANSLPEKISNANAPQAPFAMVELRFEL